MRRVLSFLKPYKLHIIIAYLLTFVELVIELSLPLLLGIMINEGVITKNIDNVLYWGSILVGLALISFLSGIINSFYASHTSNHFAYDIRKKLFHRIQSFSLTTLNKLATSKLVTLFTNDVRQVQMTIFMGLRIMTRAPLLIIGSVIMAFIINVKLASIFAIVVPIVTILVLLVMKRTANMFQNVQQKVDNVNLVLQENLLNMKLIKAFVRHPLEQDKFKQANDSLTIETRRTFRFIESSMPMLLLLMNLTIVFVLSFGHSQILQGQSTVGDVVAIVNYAARIAMSISMLTFIMLNISRMQASAKRLNDVLSIKERDIINKFSNKNKQTIKNNAITFKHVNFSYPHSKKVTLNNINFSIKQNETIAILGSTGSGKTTLFQLITQLYKPNDGKIFIGNEPIINYPINQLRKQIGYVPQSPLLFSGTVEDNLKWGKRDATKEEIIKATKDAQINHVIESLPNKYHTEISQRGVNLSGGQKQRLSIARALIRDPKILLLDDCTSALDYTTETNLLKAISTYNCTTLIITQKISTALNCDRILLLDNGEILHFGTHKQLMNNSPLYVDMVNSQREKELTNVT